MEEIKPGDSVFLKLDADGNLIRISASDNIPGLRAGTGEAERQPAY